MLLLTRCEEKLSWPPLEGAAAPVEAVANAADSSAAVTVFSALSVFDEITGLFSFFLWCLLMVSTYELGSELVRNE